MNKPRARWLAVAASFCVYLIPLITPHGVFLVGEALFQGGARRSLLWMAANCGVALAVQLLAFGYFYWLLRKPGWRRGVPALLAFPFVFMALERAYLTTIPTLFLEEPDVAQENLSWPIEFTTPGVFQTNLKTSTELWARFNNQPNRYAVLTMPGRRLTTVDLPQPTYTPGVGVDFSIDITSVISGGRAVVRRYESKSRKESWWMIPGLVPLAPPAGHSGDSGAPILSTDGRWVAWLEVIPGTGPPVLNRVFLRPRDSSEQERIVDLSSLGAAIYFLEKLDMDAEELTLWRGHGRVAIGFDGRVKKEFTKPDSVRAQPTTYLDARDYWLAWDAYRDSEPYGLEWSLAGGFGRHRAPLGRTIHSAAFDGTGRWIAVSVGTSLNIGNARDAVYILSASDGREVFRKYLPRYTRSPVAFLDGGYFVYSDEGGMRVLRVP